jgi:phosphate transport system permease protein
VTRATSPEWWPRWRRFKDQCATVAISTGGGVVLFTILMLFVFLIYEVMPLLRPATLSPQAPVELEQAAATRWLEAEEYGVLAFGLDSAGNARFLRMADGSVLEHIQVADAAAEIMAFASGSDSALALGYRDGSVQVLQASYSYTVREEERRVTPVLDHPWGKPALQVGDTAVNRLALGRDNSIMAVQTADGELTLWQRADSTAAEGAGVPKLQKDVLSLGVQADAADLHLLDGGRWLVLLTAAGDYRLWSLVDSPVLASQGSLFGAGVGLTASGLLQGELSLVVAASDGGLHRYLITGRGEQGALTRVRSYDTAGVVIERLLPEQRRRGFLAFGGGELQWFHATAGERSLRAPLAWQSGDPLALSPRADRLLLADGQGLLRHWQLENPHPEVSMTSLWRKVWYESYEEPAWIYQSSASSNNYESKYSMTPLAFGTIKAAFYAMLFATPVAIGGAIYTAFFLAPALRRRIKPLVELMEAMPTVILGFLAGLWLAPLVEDHLARVVTVMVLLPVGVLAFALLWSRLPLRWRGLLPEGWHAIVLLPVMIGLVWLGIALGGPVEHILFAGDARTWVSTELGLAYDQRNAMIVGIAMGFAVIPTIFSIAEDAIYSVPRHLSQGSLALGATPWQTLTGVVLPTASPGVFSALMIGFGRAVGETMIVLMATGNTPIMDFNLFEGMRTLAADIAVEVPEAEVDSTHYRILFLAAFVLFIFTFGVNTIAEVVRQRLRARYGALG